MNDEIIDAAASYVGILETTTGRRYQGNADFTEHGMVIDGVPLPVRHQVIGLPPHVRFVPYENILTFEFERADDEPEFTADDEKLFGGSE